MTYDFFPLFLQLYDVYEDPEAARMSDDNTNIDEMSEMLLFHLLKAVLKRF